MISIELLRLSLSFINQDECDDRLFTALYFFMFSIDDRAVKTARGRGLSANRFAEF